MTISPGIATCAACPIVRNGLSGPPWAVSEPSGETWYCITIYPFTIRPHLHVRIEDVDLDGDDAGDTPHYGVPGTILTLPPMPIMPSTSERRPMKYTTKIGSTDRMTAAIIPGMSIPNWL